VEIDFLGRTITLDRVVPSTAEWIRGTWFAPMASAAAGAAGRDLYASIEVVERGESLPAAIVGHEAGEGLFGSRHFTLENDEVWIIDGGEAATCGAHLRLGGRSSTIELYGVPFTGWFSLQSALSEALGATGLVLLHAAAIHHGSDTVALVGPSGRGKSTSLVRAIMGGWQPVSEDGCWLDVESLQLVGGDRKLRLLPSSLELLHEARPDLDPGPLVGPKYEIDFDSIGDRVGSAKLTGIAQLRRSEATMPHWEPATPTSAVMALFQASGVPHTSRVRRRYASYFGDIVNRVACTTLLLGDRSEPIPTAREGGSHGKVAH